MGTHITYIAWLNYLQFFVLWRHVVKLHFYVRLSYSGGAEQSKSIFLFFFFHCSTKKNCFSNQSAPDAFHVHRGYVHRGYG